MEVGTVGLDVDGRAVGYDDVVGAVVGLRDGAVVGLRDGAVVGLQDGSVVGNDLHPKTNNNITKDLNITIDLRTITISTVNC